MYLFWRSFLLIFFSFLHLYPSNVSLSSPLALQRFFTSTPPTFLHLYPSNVSSPLALQRFFTSTLPTFLHLYPSNVSSPLPFQRFPLSRSLLQFYANKVLDRIYVHALYTCIYVFCDNCIPRVILSYLL